LASAQEVMFEQCVRPSQLKLEGGFEIEGEGLDALNGMTGPDRDLSYFE